MAIDSTAPPGHDYKVFVSVEPNKDERDDEPSSMLKFQCNVRIKYVSNITDASIPTSIKDHDSWSFFQLPYDVLTSDDNFSSFQPRSYISKMLNLMEIPFELQLDRLFWKQSHQDKEYVPLENPDNIVTLIFDAASAMADSVALSEGKGLDLLVTIEKEVTVPHGKYVGMLKAKQDDNMVEVILKSGLSEGLQNYVASLNGVYSLLKKNRQSLSRRQLQAQCGCQLPASLSPVPGILHC